CQIREGSPAVGRTVTELKLRAETGATLLAIRRGGRLMTNPEAGFRFEPGDVAILFGDREQVDAASVLLDPTMFQPPPHGNGDGAHLGNGPSGTSPEG